MTDLANLLKEIKELPKARNHEPEKSSAALFDSHAIQLAENPEDYSPSELNRAAETSVRDSQCATPASRPSHDDTARYSSGNPEVEEILYPDGADRTRYYEMTSSRIEISIFKSSTMPPRPVETRESVLIAGPSWSYCEYPSQGLTTRC
jgi:hypothetical protein